MNKNRKIKRGVTAGIAAGMSFLLGALPVCAADTSAVSYTHLTLPTTPYV